ncbi:MAG: 30S ribosomal protein S4 [Planctomycetaceae bacterium]|nr:30S ribosomal protein S4 [Planctomycetaceae bacterium]HCK42395.1 30S ribosomal protein S4 [Planctomycetaceae bacterium]|tara:strand:- start:45 stop:653 length:609 start_codon:yes stop_codon:yes gene_type:complete
MAHYTGPRARINRRLGAVIFENAGASRAMERKPNPPGMAVRPRKLSTYGEAMREKQKIKYYYGLGERQLRKLFQKAKHTAGNSGENLLLLCEKRLDSVVRLAGFAKTRSQARQGVAHGHFLVNGRRTDVASYQVRVGDVIHVKRRANLSDVYRGNIEMADGQAADWLTVDNGQQEIIVSRMPTAEDITLPVDVGMVIELLSR